jgi:hypothetical protein
VIRSAVTLDSLEGSSHSDEGNTTGEGMDFRKLDGQEIFLKERRYCEVERLNQRGISLTPGVFSAWSGCPKQVGRPLVELSPLPPHLTTDTELQ